MGVIEQLFQKLTNENARSVVYLTDGFSNASYLINGEKVFRLKKISDSPFYSAQNEGTILKLIAPNRIGPKLYYFDYATGNMIDRYIEGDHRFVAPEISEEDLKALALIIKRLHAIQGCTSEFYPFQRYQSYQLRSGLSLNPEEENKISAKARSFYTSEPLVLSHNDLVHDNILKNDEGQIVIIDYETAGLNNEFFDLASLLSENKIFALDKIAFFVKAYFGSAYSDNHFKKTILWMAYENYLWFYWASCRYKETHYEGFNDIAKDKKEAIALFSDLYSKHPDYWPM
jgi:thiamine kinase-like enzyme